MPHVNVCLPIVGVGVEFPAALAIDKPCHVVACQVDIQHTFVLDDGSHTVENCQQKELFQHFSKLEQIADREAPQYSMQQVLDMAGLTWANVPEAVRRSWLGEVSSGSGTQQSSDVRGTAAGTASSSVGAPSSKPVLPVSDHC